MRRTRHRGNEWESICILKDATNADTIATSLAYIVVICLDVLVTYQITQKYQINADYQMRLTTPNNEFNPSQRQRGNE